MNDLNRLSEYSFRGGDTKEKPKDGNQNDVLDH